MATYIQNTMLQYLFHLSDRWKYNYLLLSKVAKELPICTLFSGDSFWKPLLLATAITIKNKSEMWEGEI